MSNNISPTHPSGFRDGAKVHAWSNPDHVFAAWSDCSIKRVDAPDIFVARCGTGKPNLLFCPGVCDPWHGFEPLFEALKPHFTLYAMDLRGHGFSQRANDGAYQVVDYIRDAIDVIDQCMTGDVAIFGNSLGALIAAGVASKQPERVRCVILEDGPFFLTEPERWATSTLREAVFKDIAKRIHKRDAQKLDRAAFEDLYAARKFAFMPEGDLPLRVRWANKFLTLLEAPRQAMDALSLETMDAAIARMVAGGTATWGELFPRDMLRGAALKYENVDWRVPDWTGHVEFSAGLGHMDMLESLSCPTLVLEADRDLSGLLGPDAIDTMRTALGDQFSYCYVEGALHEIHLTHPDVVAAQVIAFAK